MAVDLRAPETYQALLSSTTPTDTLDAIGAALIADGGKFGDAPFLWRLLAMNPALPSSLAEEAAKKSPGDFLINPAFPLLAYANPAIGNPIPDMVAQNCTHFCAHLILLKNAIEGHCPSYFMSRSSHAVLEEAFDLAVRLREGPAMYHLGQALYEACAKNQGYEESMRKMVRGLIGAWPLECLPLLYAMLDVPDGYAPQPAPEAFDVMRASVTLDAPPPADPKSTANMGICLPHGHPWHGVAGERTYFRLGDNWEFVNAAAGYLHNEHTAERLAAGMRRNDVFAVAIACLALDADAKKPMWRRMSLKCLELLWEALEPFTNPDEQPGFAVGKHPYRKDMKHARAWPAVEKWIKSDTINHFMPVALRPPPPEIMDLPNSVLRDWCALNEWPWKNHGEREFDRNHIRVKAILWMQALAAREPHYQTDAVRSLDLLVREFGRTDEATQLAHFAPGAIPAMVDGMMAVAAEEE